MYVILYTRQELKRYVFVSFVRQATFLRLIGIFKQEF